MVSVSKAVGEGSNLVLVLVMYALVIGSILATSAFSSITIINTTTTSTTLGTFYTGIIAFLGISGTVLGIVFLVRYVKPLFDKKQGMGNLTA